MKISDLAQSLGISRQMTHRLKARGMPCDSLESAIEWRRQNLDITQTKRWRIDGNSGVKRQPAQVNKSMVDDDAKDKIVSKALTRIVPELWFSQINRLGTALREHDINVSAESLVKIQSLLFLLYMIEVDRYLKTEAIYELPPALMVQPGDKSYPSLITLLNQTLNKEKTL